MSVNGDRGVKVKVSGDYACFSRPEFKVERVSYPVITPSAARGVLEAVFWKPEIRYQIRQIHVLKLGSQTTILRNEIKDRQGGRPFAASQRRQQRTSLILRNVSYAIHAEIEIRPYVQAVIGKYLDQFRRRVERGQCHHTPCLGTREFAASFEVPGADDYGRIQNPDLELDLGQMLFDIAFVESSETKPPMKFFKPTPEGQKEVGGFAEPLFFHAKIESGILAVPAQCYQELYRMEAEHA